MADSSHSLAIPAAIVLGSAIMATGLYFGLRQPAQPTVTAVVAPVVEPGPKPEPPAPVLTPELHARATDNARLALEARRADIVRRCWASAVAKQPEPRQVPVVYNFSFTPQGQLGGFGISEDRAANRSDVAGCLRSLELRLQIPAPGIPVQVEVPFTLP